MQRREGGNFRQIFREGSRPIFQGFGDGLFPTPTIRLCFAHKTQTISSIYSILIYFVISDAQAPSRQGKELRIFYMGGGIA